MRPIRALILMLALLVAAPAVAQTAITSERPDSVSVTIYREAGGGKLDLRWLTGYALVTEKRTVRIPAGRSVIRFEGVAGGIFPESAIVTGLPDGVIEKNLDADLLSARTLFGRSFGRPVTLTRRNANGTLTSERAIIRSAPDGAAILQTKDGFIAASCTGDEAIRYDSVPEGLSAKPTLSIETNSAEAREVTVTLSYLAWGFDWQVNYVATMRPDGRSAELVAWVTLASSDVTSFADAETMLVAGSINRESNGSEAGGRFATSGALPFRCMATHVERVVADDFGETQNAPLMMMAEPMSLKRNSDSVVDSISAEDIGAEDLGDVKLYRVPERTTVASNAQKQVLLFNRPSISVQLYYGVTADLEQVNAVAIYLRLRNRKSAGLGIPLPRGQVSLFEPLGERRLLVGEGSIKDRAIDEEFEIGVGNAEQVTADYAPVAPKPGWQSQQLVVTNANPYPVRFEASIDNSDVSLDRSLRPKPPTLRGDGPLVRKGGYWVWSVEIPANSSVTLRLRK